MKFLGTSPGGLVQNFLNVEPWIVPIYYYYYYHHHHYYYYIILGSLLFSDCANPGLLYQSFLLITFPVHQDPALNMAQAGGLYFNTPLRLTVNVVSGYVDILIMAFCAKELISRWVII